MLLKSMSSPDVPSSLILLYLPHPALLYFRYFAITDSPPRNRGQMPFLAFLIEINSTISINCIGDARPQNRKGFYFAYRQCAKISLHRYLRGGVGIYESI
jgi:hypothetical protein